MFNNVCMKILLSKCCLFIYLQMKLPYPPLFIMSNSSFKEARKTAIHPLSMPYQWFISIYIYISEAQMYPNRIHIRDSCPSKVSISNLPPFGIWTNPITHHQCSILYTIQKCSPPKIWRAIPSYTLNGRTCREGGRRQNPGGAQIDSIRTYIGINPSMIYQRRYEE